MSVAERPTAERLLDGATQIGAFYRAGDRCATMGWRVEPVPGAESCEVQIEPEDLCKCGVKATRFCSAKVKGLHLALCEPRDIQSGEFGLAWTMSGKEWDAPGLALLWDPPEIGVMKVGKRADVTMADLNALSVDPMSGRTTLILLKKFPGAK